MNEQSVEHTTLIKTFTALAILKGRMTQHTYSTVGTKCEYIIVS